MLYFHLLSLLPPDLVYYIYQINLKELKETSVNIILNKFYYNKLCNETIVLLYNFINNPDDLYIHDDLIYIFNFMVNKNFPKKYNKIFWENLLNLLSIKFNRIHDRILMYNNNTNNNNNYRNFKIIINLWLKICQKYFIKLQFAEYTNKKQTVNYIVRKSLSVTKLLNFNKYRHSPRVIDNNDDIFGFDENIIFIQEMLNLA
tara:strand:- start:2061 stop:2666 length:606 start_codon:yes stop_codon:yes gene_type:complete